MRKPKVGTRVQVTCGVFNQPNDCEGGCQNCGTKYDFVMGERL